MNTHVFGITMQYPNPPTIIDKSEAAELTLFEGLLASIYIDHQNVEELERDHKILEHIKTMYPDKYKRFITTVTSINIMNIEEYKAWQCQDHVELYEKSLRHLAHTYRSVIRIICIPSVPIKPFSPEFCTFVGTLLTQRDIGNVMIRLIHT